MFLVAASITLAGFLTALLLREQPLRRREQPRSQPAAEPDAAARPKPIAA